MEDLIIKKGYWAYMLRVDIREDFNQSVNDFHEWAKKYDCVYYIVGKEVSEKDKPHMQCITWFESKQNATKLRNWWKTRCAGTKQPVAFTSAKKIKNLAKYSMKDNNFLTNLHSDEITRIGKWETPAKRRQEWNIELEEKCKEIAKKVTELDQNHWDSNETSQWTGTYGAERFLSEVLEYYREKEKRPCRGTLQYLLWKHKMITNADYISALNILPFK